MQYMKIDLYSSILKKTKDKDRSFKIYENIHPSSANFLRLIQHPPSSPHRQSPPSQPLPSSTAGSSPWWFFGGLATDSCCQLFFAVHPEKQSSVDTVGDMFLLRSYDFLLAWSLACTWMPMICVSVSPNLCSCGWSGKSGVSTIKVLGID